MKQLKRISLVQFYLHEIFDIEVEGSTAFLGHNGSGKSSTLDAIQIAMLGGNQQYLRFNTQSVSSKQSRTLAGYCLGMLRNPDKDSEVIGRARDEARTYIILVFSDGSDAGTVSAGLCIEADIESNQHEIKGLFVLPGQNLKAADCIIYDGDDRRPMLFSDFREMVRDRSKKIGRTPIITDKSSEYISELLYALNGERMPDSRRFMSAFVKSMTLKNVDSIDQFVRDYVVEPNPVDIVAFRKQVEQFVTLHDLIRKTKARISRLMGIISEFDRAHAAERRIAVLEAIKAIFNTEQLVEKIDALEARLHSIQEQCKLASDYAESAKAKRDQKQEQITSLKIRLETDENEQLRLRLEEKIKSHEELVYAYQQPEITRANRILIALRDLVDDEDFSTAKNLMKKSIQILINACNDKNPGVSIADALKEIDFKELSSVVIAQLELSRRRLTSLTEEKEAIRCRISAANKTGRLMNDGAALLLGLLNAAGMNVQPISALTNISDSSWAPAIEAYLGSDRDALVVIEGNTQHAVKILRDARHSGRRIDGASIVQPNHLKSIDVESKGTEYAVSLLDVKNDTARRFLWQKFGNMRLVDSEAELEKFNRAITQDGMLSQGGLTKSIRVVPVSDLRLGKDIEDTLHLSRHLAELQGKLDILGKKIKQMEALEKSLSNNSDDTDNSTDKLNEAAETIKNAKNQLTTLNVYHLDEIRKTLRQYEEEQKQFDNEYTKNDRLAAGLIQQIDYYTLEMQNIKEQLPDAQRAEHATRCNPLVDLQLMDELKEEIERTESIYTNRIAEANNKLSYHQSRLNAAEDRASVELSRYVHDERLDVQIADMDWHDRHRWSIEDKRKLTDTHLQNYESEAEQARQAAEETLRSDIAMSLHDRFKEMEMERRERNKILESCPAFTGGERYRFTSSVVPHYEPLVKYVNQLAQNDQNFSLFSDNSGEIDETLRELIDAAAESNNARAVLDYRQFFTFDLDILVDGKRVDRMSNRQGAGSNGEHIAPMYVAAGAALAKAYRLHNRKGQQNAIGLICLDEAFHGMDTINAIATARFLQNIGLQLIMAGPELELTKLAPITQTIYNLDREGFDLLIERTHFKPEANTLMVSDMPEENPQVMINAYQQLGLEVPTTSSTL